MARRSAPVDDRTTEMSADHLLCRGFRHKRTPVPPGPKRRAELAKVGQIELRQTCERCGHTTYEVLDYDGATISRWADPYPPGYLLPSGSGRLRAGRAKVAWLARQNLI
jgi:hypothetical protein